MRTRFSTGTEGQSFIASRRTALAAYLPVRAGYRWRRPFRGPHHRPGPAHGQAAARPEALVVERHRPGARRPAGLLLERSRRNLPAASQTSAATGSPKSASRTMSLGGRAPGLWAIGGRVNIGAANHPSSPGRLRDALGLAFRSTLRNAASDRSIRAALRSRK